MVEFAHVSGEGGGTVRKSLSRYLSGTVGAAVLVAVVAACGSSAPTPSPAAPTAAPTVAPTPSPTPTPTATAIPTPTPPPPSASPSPSSSPSPVVAVPSAPGRLTWRLPCHETLTCVGDEPFEVAWTAARGTVSGYRLYYTPGNWFPCTGTWTATGRARLLGTYGPSYRGWVGRLSWGGKLGIVAFNGAGTSAATFSTPVDLWEWTCP